jgi:hypothetical protein
MFPPEKSPTFDANAVRPKRWYDHDPALLELLQLLELFKYDIAQQSVGFLKQVEALVSPEALKQAYQAIEPYMIQRRRWYDDDMNLAKALELLKLLPPAQQRQVALSFIMTLKNHPKAGQLIPSIATDTQDLD